MTTDIHPYSAIAKSIKAATTSKLGSRAFLNRITRSIFEEVLYTRFNFDQEEFKTLKFNDRVYHVLRKTPYTPCLIIFKQILDTTLELLDNNKIKKITIVFCEKVNNNPVEFYEIDFTDIICDSLGDYWKMINLKKEMSQSTFQTFKSIFNLNNNSPLLNDKIGIRIILNLKDENSNEPSPPHLLQHEECEEVGAETLKNYTNDFKTVYNIGCINTGWYKIKIQAKGTIFEQHSAAEEEKCISPLEVEDTVNCPCEITTTFKKIDMLCCLTCHTQQHAACVGYGRKEEAPNHYRCFNCTDMAVSQELALIRLFLLLSLKMKTFPKKFMTCLPSLQQEKLVAWLYKKSYIEKTENGFTTNFNVVSRSCVEKILNIRENTCPAKKPKLV